MSPPPVYDTRRAPNASTTTSMRPYLTLPYLLSLTWLAYPILSLLFVGFRLQLSSSAAQDSVADARGNLLTSCKAAEEAATATASMPRYLAQASNRQVADAVNGTMNAARATLILALTILQAVINFVIDIYRSTFFCFLELVVRGGLAILIGAVQEVCSEHIFLDLITYMLPRLRLLSKTPLAQSQPPSKTKSQTSIVRSGQRSTRLTGLIRSAISPLLSLMSLIYRRCKIFNSRRAFRMR